MSRGVIGSRGVISLNLLLVLAHPAVSAEVCISCDKPAAVYRCSVERAADLQKYGIEEAKVLPPVCTKILAKNGKHAGCQVIGKPGEPCNGVERKLGVDDLRQALAGDGAGSTVVPSLADRAGDAAQSTGSTITGAFKKTWTCVTTLFQKCS